MNTQAIHRSITFTGKNENDGTTYTIRISPMKGEDYVQAAKRVIKNSYVLKQVVAFLTYDDSRKA